MAREMAPSPRPDDAGCLDWRKRLDRLERQQEARPDAAIAPLAAANVDDRGGRVGDMTVDGPALVANADDVAAAQGGGRHAARMCRPRSPSAVNELRENAEGRLQNLQSRSGHSARKLRTARHR